MSGICGVVFHDGQRNVDSPHLSPMLEGLASRQNGQTFIYRNVGLGSAPFPGRISVAHHEGWNGQPMGLVLHGCIFNQQELFGDDVDRCSQIKALLTIYQKEGIGFVERIRGEFIVALWDGLQEILYLVTDRFRVHPLFYYLDQEKLVFASSIKALTACPLDVKRSINPCALVIMAASYSIPTPQTIFKEIKKIPPGSYLMMKHGQLTVKTYWDVQFSVPSRMPRRELTNALREQFDEALSIRLACDGVTSQIGTFLSGGIDSTTVTGVITRLLKRQIDSFSIGFLEQSFNEMEYARIAAKAFGSGHHEYYVSAEDTISALPILTESFDEPYGNSSAIPAYFCAKLARDHGIKFLYAGDGGDELFAGNKRYATQKLFDYYFCMPVWLRRFFIEPSIFGLEPLLPVPILSKSKRYIQRAKVPYPSRLCAHGLYEIIPLPELFDDEILEAIGFDFNPYCAVYEHYAQAQANTELDRQLYVDLKLVMTDNDLIKVMKATEAAGVTVRFPFTDHKFVEFAASVPAALKMRGLTLRTFFKEAYSELLPQEVRNKSKHGFGLPIHLWLRTHQGLNEMMRDLVLSPRSVQRGYFKKKMLEKIVKGHQTDSTSFYGTILWNLMMLELWHRRYWN